MKIKLKYIILFSTLSISIFLNIANSKKSHRLLGKFIYLNINDSRNISGHEYYFYLSTSKGEKMAYPVTIKNQALIKKIQSNIKQSFFIEGNILEKSVVKGEFTKKIKIIEVNNAKVITLKDISNNKVYDPKGFKVSKDITINSTDQHQVAIMKNVNDTVTNVTIFTAGAALLASILLGK